MKKLISLLLCLMLGLTGLAMAEDAPALSDSIYDFQVQLEGVVYQLPMPVKQLLDNGWTFEEAGESLQPNYYTYSVGLQKDDMTFRVYLFNPDIITRPYEDCYVVQMSFDPDPYDAKAPAVSFAKGIGLTSTEEEIIAAYGQPTDLRESDPGKYLVYEYDIRQEFSVDFYKGSMTSMELYNFTDEMPGAVRSAYDPEPTAVYSRYAAHEDDGTLFGHSLTVDGESYQLLTPLQTFVDNGWKVKEVDTYLDEDYIAANDTARVELFKDNQTMDVRVKNYDQDRAAKVGYCFVIEVTFEQREMSNMPAAVPGFSLGMSTADLTAALENVPYVEAKEYDYSNVYRVGKSEEDDTYMTIYVNNEKGVVSELTVEYRPGADELPF